MITHPQSAVNTRAPYRTYRTIDGGRVACISYRDANLGLVAVSIRTAAGFTSRPRGLAWNLDTLAELERDETGWLEVQIRGTTQLYRTRIETMRAYGREDTRYPGQLVLPLGLWAAGDDDLFLETEAAAGEDPWRQLSLFGE